MTIKARDRPLPERLPWRHPPNLHDAALFARSDHVRYDGDSEQFPHRADKETDYVI
jgi:hypothetical protein